MNLHTKPEGFSQKKKKIIKKKIFYLTSIWEEASANCGDDT